MLNLHFIVYLCDKHKDEQVDAYYNRVIRGRVKTSYPVELIEMELRNGTERICGLTECDNVATKKFGIVLPVKG